MKLKTGSGVPSEKSSLKPIRLDVRVVDLGLAPTRTKAQALIMANEILVNDVPQTKPGTVVALKDTIRLRSPIKTYVSRSAHKLLGALDHFSVDFMGRIVLDVGASTGGFTQVCLERGAKKVYAVDVGTHQLEWSLRNDSRVVSLEQHNAREMTSEWFADPIERVVMDVSFISVRLIFPAILASIAPGTEGITLFKPQFELGREHIGKGGIVKDEALGRIKCESWCAELESQFGVQVLGSVPSDLRGTDGNLEHLVCWKWPGKTPIGKDGLNNEKLD